MSPSENLHHPPSQLSRSVKNALSIAVICAALKASILVDTAPTGVRAFLVPLASAEVRSAETSASGGVWVTALIREVTDLISGAGTPSRTAASHIRNGARVVTGRATILRYRLV